MKVRKVLIDSLVWIPVEFPPRPSEIRAEALTANLDFVVLFTGRVEYSHRKGESGGSFHFKFDAVDGKGNKLIDQSFSISVLGKGAFVCKNTSAAQRLNSLYCDGLEAKPFLYPTGKEAWDRVLTA